MFKIKYAKIKALIILLIIFLFKTFLQNGKLKYAKLIPLINNSTKEMEGKGKFELDSDEEHGIGLSPLFNTVLHNKFVRLFSENIYESFSHS